MSRRDYYEGDEGDDDGYRPHEGNSDDSENYNNSADYGYEDPELDSEAINDFTSQELDKRIQQMKAKIKDLQEEDMEFNDSPQHKEREVSGRKDYKLKEDDSEEYESPKRYKGKETPQKLAYDQDDSEDQYANESRHTEKERLKNKIEDIKKAIQQYNSEEDDKPEDSKVGRYYEEDEEDYQYNTKPKQPTYAKRDVPRKQWKDTDQEEDARSGKLVTVNYDYNLSM